MLKVSKLEVKRGDNILKYDFDLVEGQILAVKGESGVGKTSLLDCIAGFIPAHSGQILWNNEEITHEKVENRPVSMLFQDFNLFEHLSVKKNLEIALPQLNESEILTALSSLLVNDHLHKLPSELSGGQKQRVGILRSLLRPEPLILMDEPFSELDAQTRKVASQWLKGYCKAQRKTVILVTHQEEDITELSDQVLALI